MFSLGKVCIQLRHLNDQSFNHENRLIMRGVLFSKFNCLCLLNLEVVSFKVFDNNIIFQNTSQWLLPISRTLAQIEVMSLKDQKCFANNSGLISRFVQSQGKSNPAKHLRWSILRK